MSNYQLDPGLFTENIKLDPIRAGLGRGLVAAGEANDKIVALCADLTESTQIAPFREKFPQRFVQVGIAEQNLVTVASGMALAGKIPFASAYAAFSPGRNWEQIKTTICLNDQPVKIVASHAGVTVGPDGATHQMLEDIALMRVLPNMVVIVPGDSVEAEKATKAMAENGKPTYIRLGREKTPVFSTPESPFEIGKAYILRDGADVSLMGTGTMTYQMLVAANILADNGINAEVVHVPTIKPLDEETILDSAKRTGRVVTAEEAQVIGGLGGAIAELTSEKLPVPIMRIGMNDRFGESGEPNELLDYFGLTGEHIAKKVQEFISVTPRYHQENSEVEAKTEEGNDLEKIRENTAKARALMQRSREQHFAIGAFNVDNQETLIAIAKAAQKLNSPVLIELSKNEVQAMGLKNIRNMVDNYKVEYEIEMYINLDHSPTVQDCKEAIDAGFEFIHIDVSQGNHDATDEEIIAQTREVVEYAKRTGAIVEGEPHYFGGSSDVFTESFDYEEIKKTFSTPEGAKAFVDATGIDTYAAAIGNLHGKYPVPKILDLDLLQRIRDYLSPETFISLHGGSDTPLNYFEGAAKIGVSKVNVNTDLRFAFRTTLDQELDENADQYAVVKLMPEVENAVQAVVEEKISAFGSAGKAIV